ncbi:MAG: cytochrome c [Gammaproteobacteria bacterium]|nr:cytochrome c [Gammaproteobacteria bacterium]
MRFALATTCWAALGAASAATAAGLGDGLYSSEQAARGAEAYRATCSSCHALDLRGNSNSPGLRGIGFLFVWEGRSLGEFFTQMRTTMPQESPGSLTEGQYLDILAYILEQNDYPAGGADLANASGELDTVVISAP